MDEIVFKNKGFTATMVLTAILLATGVPTTLHARQPLYDCRESERAAVDAPCRVKTIGLIDSRVMDHLLTLLKFDGARYSADEEYALIADAAAEVFFDAMLVDFEFEVNHRVFGDIPEDSTNRRAHLVRMLREFELQRAGCMFTRERLGDVQMSRSLVAAFMANQYQRYLIIDVHFTNIHTLHNARPSQRQPRIVAIEINALLPGRPNSNAVLSTHILPDPSDLCRNILALMDQGILSELRGNE